MAYKIKYRTFTVSVAENTAGTEATTHSALISYLRPIFDGLDADQEHFILICMDSRLRIKSHKVLFSGGATSSIVDSKILFRAALLAGASRIAIAHNHPAGDPRPSSKDDHATEKIKDGAVLLDIQLVDHIILSGVSGEEPAYYSYSVMGRL